MLVVLTVCTHARAPAFVPAWSARLRARVRARLRARARARVSLGSVVVPRSAPHESVPLRQFL